MKPDRWENTLFDYIHSSSSLAFEWGTSDCCLWVACYVDLVSGSSHSDGWKGRYNTAEGAQAVMESMGFSCPEDIADRYLKRKSVKHATRGDVVMFEGGALGLCAGRKSYFFVEDRGLSALPTLKCLAAWEI